VAHRQEMRSMYKMLFGNLKGKRPLRRHRHVWEGNIKMNFREVELEGVN
jgi:hypothetical protein